MRFNREDTPMPFLTTDKTLTTLEQLRDQLHSADSLLRAALKSGVYEWGIWEIKRYVNECQKVYTKALQQQMN